MDAPVTAGPGMKVRIFADPDKMSREAALSAYCFFDILEITDSATFQEYARRIGPTVERFGGRYLIRGGKMERLEGDWQPLRPVVIEFPSLDQAKQWHESADYQELIALRSGVAKERMDVPSGILTKTFQQALWKICVLVASTFCPLVMRARREGRTTNRCYMPLRSTAQSLPIIVSILKSSTRSF